MANAAETKPRRRARAALSAVVAAALLMPAFPLSEVAPAWAYGQVADGSQSQYQAVVPLDATETDAAAQKDYSEDGFEIVYEDELAGGEADLVDESFVPEMDLQAAEDFLHPIGGAETRGGGLNAIPARMAALSTLSVASSSGKVYKDITAVELYAVVNGAVQAASELPSGDLGDYVVYVSSAHAPSFFASLVSAGAGSIVVREPFGGQMELPFPFAQAGEDAAGFLDELSSQPGYQESRAVAYANVVALSPFLAEAAVVQAGNALSGELAAKPIRSVLAFDADGAMVPCRDVPAASVKVVFDDGAVLDGAVSGESLSIGDATAPYEHCGYSLGEDNAAVARVAERIQASAYLEYFSAFAEVDKDNRVQREHWVNVVQANARSVARDILANSGALMATAPDNKVYQALLDKALGTDGTPADLRMMPLLYTYNYIKRWYDFDVEGIHAADLLLFGGSYYGSGCTLDGLAARFAVSQPSQRKGESTQVGYAQLIYPCLRQDAAIASVKGLVEDLVAVFTDFESADDWFIYEYNKTGVVEEGQPDEDGFSWRAWTNLSKDGTVGYVRNGQRRILPFLTLPDYSYYAFSLPSVFSYGSPYMYYTDPSTPENQQKLRERVKKNQQLQLNYIETIVGFTGRKATWNAMLFLDQDKQCINAWTTPWQAWWGENGCTEANATQDPMIKGFYEVLQLPPPTRGSAACGGNEIVRWRCNAKLDDFLVWSHEFGHCIDEKILCGGATRKDVAECYTFGMLEQGLSSSAFGLNIAYDYPWENAYSMNASFKSLRTSESAQQFYGGLFELIDILDYLELKAFLRLSTADQQAVATQLWYGGDNRMNGDYGGPTFILYDPASVSRFASGMGVYVSDEAKADIQEDGETVRHFDSIEEVFDHRVCLMPNVSATSHPEWAPSAYGRDTILSRWWYLPHCNNGGTATAAYKSLSFRMAGEAGYYGFQQMLAGNWNDTQALRNATGKKDFKEYKLDTYAEIEQRLGDLRWIDADELEERYLAAFKSAAAKGDRSLAEANNIRLQTFALMKRLTRDFDDTLFSPTTEAMHITSAVDLAKIAENPCGAFVLDNDIEVTVADGAAFVLDVNFRGYLNGQGHTIRGDFLPPLFRESDRATVRDLAIHDSSAGTIAVKMSNVNVWNVDISVRDTSTLVSNVEEFLAMAQDPSADYRIVADIDFSDHKVAAAGSTLIAADFTGTIAGDGHVLSGLTNAALFNRFKGTARDLQIRDFTNEKVGGDGMAAFAKFLSGATIENVAFSNIKLSGKYRTGALCGNDENPSTISRVSVVSSAVTGQDAGCYNSLLVGRKNGGAMTDVHVQGTLVCQGTENAGVCGAAKGTVFTRCIADVDITRLESAHEQRTNSAGFLGNFDGGNTCTIKQCAFVGSASGECYGFTGMTDAAKLRYFTDCYEIEMAGGTSSVNGSNIKTLARADAATQMLWDGLGYQQGLWSYADVSSGNPALVFSGKAWDIRMSIDYVAETMTLRGEDAENLNIEGLWGVTEGMTSVSLAQALDTEEWDHHVTITRSDDGEHGVGYELDIDVPARPEAPSVIAVPAQGDDEHDRAYVTFPVGRSYEYRVLDSASGWKSLADQWRGDPMPISPCVMEIRCPAVTGQHFVSQTTTVDLRYRSEEEVKRYQLSFEANGGELDDPPTEYTAGHGLDLPIPVREGYVFEGWYANAELTGSPVALICASDTGDKTFWAKWAPEAYRVTLDKGGGALKPGIADVTSYSYGQGAALPELERAGYDFAGWYDNAGFAGSPIAEIGATERGEKAFWAKWEPRTYAISYNLGHDADGDVPPADIDLSAYMSYRTGEAFELPGADVMKWEEHTFAGWYADADFSGDPIAQIAAGTYGDATFYAKWVGEACAIGYRLDGGSFIKVPQTVFEFGADGMHIGSEIALPTADDVERAGYAFEGWYEDASLSGEPVQTVRLQRGDIQLYAKWSAVPYAIVYELAGGAWAPGYEPQTSYTVESGAVMLPAADDIVREGYAFKGWFADEGLTGDALIAIPAGTTGDKAFWAKWEEEAVTPPDGPDEPEEPALEIISLSFAGLDGKVIEWDKDGYARIEVLRSKMPTGPEDFELLVPEGIECDIQKRGTSFLHALARLFMAAEPETEIWDITLRRIDDPADMKVFTLEIVPVEAVEPPAEEQPPGGTEQPPAEDGKPPAGEDEPPAGTEQPPTDEKPTVLPGAGSSQGGSSGAPDGAGQPNGDGGSSGDGSDAGDAAGTPDGTMLAKTGDAAPMLVLVGLACACCAVLALAVRRRAR